MKNTLILGSVLTLTMLLLVPNSTPASATFFDDLRLLEPEIQRNNSPSTALDEIVSNVETTVTLNLQEQSNTELVITGSVGKESIVLVQIYKNGVFDGQQALETEHNGTFSHSHEINPDDTDAKYRVILITFQYASITTNTTPLDTTAPIITLVGDSTQTIKFGTAYTELGATTDDGSPVTINATALVDAVGTYNIFYDSSDGLNDAAQVIRTVTVEHNSGLGQTITDFTMDKTSYDDFDDFFEFNGLVTNYNATSTSNIEYTLKTTSNGNVVFESEITPSANGSFSGRIEATGKWTGHGNDLALVVSYNDISQSIRFSLVS